MRTRMSGSRSLWMAAALVAAMTSTVSAQAVQASAAATGPAAPIAESAAFAGSGAAMTALDVDLSSGTQIMGWCGTDVTKPLHVDQLRARIHVRALATLLHSVAQFLPVQAVSRLAAYRLWLQSSIDVLPPF